MDDNHNEFEDMLREFTPKKPSHGARWNLDQTTVFAPDDGLVTALTLRPGQRVTSFQPAMAFLPDIRRASEYCCFFRRQKHGS